MQHRTLSGFLLLSFPGLHALACEADVVEAEVDCDGPVCDFFVSGRAETIARFARGSNDPR